MGAQVLQGGINQDRGEEEERLDKERKRILAKAANCVDSVRTQTPPHWQKGKKKKSTNVCMSDFKPQEGLKLVILVVLMVCKS